MEENRAPCCGAESGKPGQTPDTVKTTERTAEEKKALLNRLSRIEGQIRGIRNMVEQDAYCIDILNQVSAASAALSGFTKVLLSRHIRHCVAEDVQNGRDEKLEELVKTLQKLMR